MDEETGKERWIKPALLPITIDGENDFSCPLRPIKDDPVGWNEMLLLYGYYQKGFLPEDGGVVDQSAYAMSLFQIVDAAKSECEDELRAREAQKQQANQHGRAPHAGKGDPRRRGA